MNTAQRSAAITGAGSGLGRDIALGLAEKGYCVFGTALVPAEVQEPTHQREGTAMDNSNQSTIEANKAIVREFVQKVFNDHNLELAREYFAPEAKWHGGILGTVEGRENITGLLRGFIGALPDLHASEQDLVAEGATVAVRFVVEATQKGDLLGIPATGRRVRWDAVDVYRLSNGEIVEEWAADDMAAILHQLGAYTPPWLHNSPTK